MPSSALDDLERPAPQPHVLRAVRGELERVERDGTDPVHARVHGVEEVHRVVLAVRAAPARGDDRRVGDLIDVRKQDDVVASATREPEHDPIALVALARPAVVPGVGRVVDDHVVDAIGPARESLAMVGVPQRLGSPAEGRRGFDEHEAVDDLIEHVEPDLEHLELVEERERVEDAHFSQRFEAAARWPASPRWIRRA